MANEKDNQPQQPAEGDKQAKPQGQPQGPPKGQHGGKPQGGPRHDRGKPQGKPKKVEDTGPQEKIEPSRLRKLYDEQVRAKIAEKFGIKNPMAQPRLEKIVLNVNMGRHLEGTKIPPTIRATVLDTLVKVSGQKPIVLKAKKSVANFKVREGLESAAMVTLRRDRMWHFLDRFINLATPRIKDFRGVSRTAFDRQGNYAVGVTEQGVFPEINMAEAQFTHGMNISFTFSRSTPELSRFVLEQLGMPFAKPDTKN